MNFASESLLGGLIPQPRQWLYVTERFGRCLANLQMTPLQIADAEEKCQRVIRVLNKVYWNSDSGHENQLLVGSRGKSTQVRPPRDVDVMFLLPPDFYNKFNNRSGNKPSQLLWAVADVLRQTFPHTKIRSDGQVIVVGFNTCMIEIIPAFSLSTGSALICDTNNGGQWKHIDPIAELQVLDTADHSYNGNVRNVTKLIKQWQRHCNVPIKSFHIENLVKEALASVIYGGRNLFWYDWIVRDVFQHMIAKAGSGFMMPGVANEWVSYGFNWQSKVQSAYDRACRACAYEQNNMDRPAGEEWQKIFGTAIPVVVT